MKPCQYDKGGWLPNGVSLVKNNTGEPMIFDHPDTWTAVSEAIKTRHDKQ